MERLSLVEKSAYYWEGEPVVESKQTIIRPGKYSMVDLCCGAGGISKGFEMSGAFEVLLGVDIFTCAIDTFKLNHPKTTTILGDVRQISDEQYKIAVGDRHINVVAAGVPCQGFSLSNKKRDKDDERNFLFLEVIRFVNNFNPDVVMIENVSGMQSTANGKFVDEIIRALSNAGGGYKVKSSILNAAEFGVPQLRKRLIFIATKDDSNMPEFIFPSPTHADRYNTVWDAIGDLPLIGAGESADRYKTKPISEFQRIMRSKRSKLYNHKAPNHPQETVEKIRSTVPGEPMYEKYRQRIRLAWDMPSPTQLAGGIRPQFQFGHPEVPRGLTVRERARIQSFPDDYIFTGGVVQGRVQTGNAVPPLLAMAIGSSIDKMLTEFYQKVKLVENM